ncbi:MAG: PqqD family protein [Acidobacteriota bacterium]
MTEQMLRLPDNLRITHTADGAVVLDVTRGRIFRFNATGSLIFRMLQCGLGEKDIVSALVRQFAADMLTAESDTAEFLAALERHSLMQPGSDRNRR